MTITSNHLRNHLITMDDVDEHYLDSYLTDILPALGLDIEAYGPYVTSFVSRQILSPGDNIAVSRLTLNPWYHIYLADERG